MCILASKKREKGKGINGQVKKKRKEVDENSRLKKEMRGHRKRRTQDREDDNKLESEKDGNKRKF